MAKVRLDRLVLDDSIFPRERVNDTTVARLVRAIKTGAVLPPIVAERNTNRIIDGWHRYRAYQQLEFTSTDAILKNYATEADAFADAVRLNVGHGVALDQYCIQKAVLRLQEYGWTREAISSVVRVPPSDLDKMQRGFAFDTESGRPLAVKGGLRHLAGQPITPQQQEVNRRYSGPKAQWHVTQLIELLISDMWPQTEAFAREMDRLVITWQNIRGRNAA